MQENKLKSKIRKEIISSREEIYKNLDMEYIEGKLLNSFQMLLNQVEVDNICLYRAKKGEISCKKLHDFLNGQHKVFYPKIVNNDLQFYQYINEEQFATASFGIEEPLYGEVLQKKALVIVPSVAIGFDGYRIGYGKGYYDKFIEKNRENIYAGFIIDQFLISVDFSEAHDQKLDYIILPIEVKKII